MKKRILSVMLCLAVLFGIVSVFSGCNRGRVSAVDAADARAQTLVLAAIKDEKTTDEAILAVQNALNEITESAFNTHIVLKLFTADEYAQKILELSDKLAVKQQEYEDKLIGIEDTGIVPDTRYDLIDSEVKKDYVTLPNGDLAYYDEFEREITVYPEVSEDQIDILFIDSIDTYYKLLENEYIISLSDSLESSTDLNKFVNTILMNQINKVGDCIQFGNKVCAVPNNYVIDSYQYILVNKALYDYYQYDVNCDVNDVGNGTGMADDLTDFMDYLDDVMANNNSEEIEKLGLKVDKFLYNYSDIPWESWAEDSPLILNTTMSFSAATAFNATSLYGKKQYKRIQNMLHQMKQNGAAPNRGDCFYLDDEATVGYKVPAANMADNDTTFALAMVSGDKAVESYYNSEDYYVVRTHVPVVRNEMFNSMFAVSTFSSTAVDMDGVSIMQKIQYYGEQYNTRAMEIINMLQTNKEAVNLLTYGVESEDYDYSESSAMAYNTGKNGYYPVVGKMGNLFLTYANDKMDARTAYYAQNGWSAAKEQNARAIVSPYCGFLLRDDLGDEGNEMTLKPSEIIAQLQAIYADYEKRMAEYEGDDMEGFIETLQKEFVNTEAYKCGAMEINNLRLNEETGEYTNFTFPFAQYTWFFNVVNKGEGSYSA